MITLGVKTKVFDLSKFLRQISFIFFSMIFRVEIFFFLFQMIAPLEKIIKVNSGNLTFFFSMAVPKELFHISNMIEL